MTYQFARIELAKTNYTTEAVDWFYIKEPNPLMIDQLNDIYRTYCIYKHFASVMPIFSSRYTDTMTDVIGYREEGQLVGFSLIKRYDTKNALCDQFAWTYRNPRTRLGIESMKTECAIYKARGFDYLYLEQAHLYKNHIIELELLGPLQ